jgi:predicted dehydrogenase
MPPEIRLGMVGMVEGNGHPYSWSAIVNGYDPELMAACPFPVIPAYLERAPREDVGIRGARVTHIWTDGPEDGPRIARTCCIPSVAAQPRDMIGHVDGVLIATDLGGEHVQRARPFVEAGLPVFVDKPLADNAEDLEVFTGWVADGAPLLSSSCMRYAKEFLPPHFSCAGEIRLVTSTTSKTWERYGMHALEAVYGIMGPGMVGARNCGSPGRDVVCFRHRSGAQLVAAAIEDMRGAFGRVAVHGTAGTACAVFTDTFTAFRAQLADFIEFVRTGIRPFPFAETVELARMLIAGIRSRDQGGREVLLEEIA